MTRRAIISLSSWKTQQHRVLNLYPKGYSWDISFEVEVARGGMGDHARSGESSFSGPDDLAGPKDGLRNMDGNDEY